MVAVTKKVCVGLEWREESQTGSPGTSAVCLGSRQAWGLERHLPRRIPRTQPAAETVST